MRQLVTKRTVAALLPIEGADRIELAKIDGWQCVVKKGDFAVGSDAIYCEVDSMVPLADPRFAFLAKGKVAPFARIKTIRLKGTLSQGLLIPANTLTPDEAARVAAGEDITNVLGVKKYEPALPIGGKQAGTFPTHLVPKTDQERIQNLPDLLTGDYKTFIDYEITEKLDGCSCTIWMHVTQDDIGVLEIDINKPEDIERWKNTVCGVASRNWEMQKDDENVYAKVLRENDLVNKLWNMGRNIAIQGEIIGPNIQGNKYNLTKQEFYVYDIYDIDAKKYLMFFERWKIAEELGLKHVPILREELHTFYHFKPQTKELDRMTFDSVLTLANGKSALALDVDREGLVFKAIDASHSFKAISNEWLLKYE